MLLCLATAMYENSDWMKLLQKALHQAQSSEDLTFGYGLRVYGQDALHVTQNSSAASRRLEAGLCTSDFSTTALVDFALGHF